MFVFFCYYQQMSKCVANISYDSRTRTFVFTRHVMWQVDVVNEMPLREKDRLIDHAVCTDCMQRIVHYIRRNIGSTDYTRTPDLENNRLHHEWKDVLPASARAVLIFDPTIINAQLIFGNLGKMSSFKLNYEQTIEQGFSADIEFLCASEIKHVVEMEYDQELKNVHGASLLERYQLRPDSWRPFERIASLKMGAVSHRDISWTYKTPEGIIYGKLEIEQVMTTLQGTSDYVDDPYRRITLRHLVDLFNEEDKVGIVRYSVDP